MRRRLVLALALAAAAVTVAPLGPGPATATTTVGEWTGEMFGEMLMSPGIPLQGGCLTGSYTLTGRSLTERARVTSTVESEVSAGLDQVQVTVTGTSSECGATGSGTAFASCTSVAALGADIDVPDGANDVLAPTATTCNMTGTMSRTGTLVLLQFEGEVNVTDARTGSQRTFGQAVKAALSLAPTFVKPCGATQCITDALVAGAITGAKQDPPVVEETRSGVGSAVYKATAQLASFPCPPPSSGGPCGGSLQGDWHGSIAGTSGSSVYSITWSAPGGISATFEYAEWQCLAGLETLVGFAVGDGTALASPGQIQGKWQVPGESFARDVTGVNAVFHFVWTRAATGAVLTFEPASMYVEVAGLGPKLVGTGPQFGTAAFAATHSDPIEGPPLCSTPIGHVEGEIAGTVTLNQVSL